MAAAITRTLNRQGITGVRRGRPPPSESRTPDRPLDHPVSKSRPWKNSRLESAPR